MRQTASALAIAALLGLGSATAFAQPSAYTGPSNAPKAAAAPAAPGGYAGPSSVPLMTVKQLLDAGKDDQHARLQGRIVSHDGGDRYTFEDATGRITVEIDDEDFPAGQTVSAQQRVELLGEFDKGLRKTEFEVDRITLIN
ncbi:NirD/YgiW/YdeI family stress tolerance protein [Xenophilus sp. Marseille-Q4582]|uniref:NirD/YgiW/YdeI family stress tolerance protein n=1 Tax=Xenophilus sp. Marseille-Q4582 TaxID=2866600 RepID=UPI001CE41CC5|nr:NirD/YgiW/YdeI family stress tolerance protein [Xenophilus sp. Marseille-Q4582]